MCFFEFHSIELQLLYTVQEHDVQERQGLRHNWSILARSSKIYQSDKRFAAWIVINVCTSFQSRNLVFWLWHHIHNLTSGSCSSPQNFKFNVTQSIPTIISQSKVYTRIAPEMKLIPSKIDSILAFLAKGKKIFFEKEIHQNTPFSLVNC